MSAIEEEIRRIVREEIGFVEFEKTGEKLDKAFREWQPGKPKTDLERAAEIADEEARRDMVQTPDYVTGYYVAARSIALRIRALKPAAVKETSLAEGARSKESQ